MRHGPVRPACDKGTFGALRPQDLADINALQQAFLDERRKLLGFLVARGAGDIAEDVLQDVWQRLPAGPALVVDSPVSYLLRCAENALRDQRRAEVSRMRRQREWLDLLGDDSVAPGGDQILIGRERLQKAEAVLRELGPRIDYVFRRFRLDGVRQATVAAELGISLGSVEKDLQKAYRALAKLKATFDAERG